MRLNLSEPEPEPTEELPPVQEDGPAHVPAPDEPQPAPAPSYVEELDRDDEIDGRAFMRGPERANLANLQAGEKAQNSLRARLNLADSPVIEEEPPSLWARFREWAANWWQRFLG